MPSVRPSGKKCRPEFGVSRSLQQSRAEGGERPPGTAPSVDSTPFLRTMDLVGSTVIIPWLVGSSEPE